MAVNRGMNARFGRMFRELTSTVLQRHFPEATPRPTAARISDAFNADEPASDVLGIPGVTVHCRADAQPGWSQSLAMAETAAAMDGNEYGVLVEYRRGSDVDQAYAVMSLDKWARLAKAAQGVTAL